MAYRAIGAIGAIDHYSIGVMITLALVTATYENDDFMTVRPG